MGIRAGFTQIPSEVFAQVAAGEEPNVTAEMTERTYRSIDKAWNDFHAVFRSMGPPLSLAISGDYRHPHSPHSLDEFCEGKHEYYVGFVSPSLVRDVAILLADLTPADYKRLESVSFGDQYNCGETFFPDLKAVYAAAAAHECALMILVS